MKVGRFAALHPKPKRPVQQGRVAPRPAWFPTALRWTDRTTPTVRAATFARTSFTVVLIGTGVSIGAGSAPAQPATAPHQFSDRTAEFVPLGAPNALAARDDGGKKLVLSPHGTRRSIVCRGDGNTVPLYDCSQEDGLGWASLHRTDTPVGEVWVYFP